MVQCGRLWRGGNIPGTFGS